MKFGFSPEQIKEKSLDPKEGQKFRETYAFSRFWRIKEAQGRSERYAKNLDAGMKRKLHDPLGEKVLILAQSLKKRMHQVDSMKAQQRTEPLKRISIRYSGDAYCFHFNMWGKYDRTNCVLGR